MLVCVSLCAVHVLRCRELSGSVTSEQLSLLIAKNVQKSMKLFVMKCEQMVRAHTQCLINPDIATML